MEDDEVSQISLRDVILFSKLFALMGVVLVALILVAPANALPL